MNIDDHSADEYGVKADVLTPAKKIDRLDYIIRSLDFLQAHPEHHAVSRLAANEAGVEVPPNATQACKWCLVGRIAYEAGITGHSGTETYRNIAAYVRPLGLWMLDLISHSDIPDPRDRKQSFKELRRKLVARLNKALLLLDAEQGKPA